MLRPTRRDYREPLRGRVGHGKESTSLEGQKMCRWCYNPVPKGRRTFCSPEYVHEHKVRSDIAYLRKQVFTRDRGVCDTCKLDTHALYLRVLEVGPKKGIQLLVSDYKVPHGRAQRVFRWGTALWDCDHIVPVSLGGGGCGLEGVRTLCVACHLSETKR